MCTTRLVILRALVPLWVALSIAESACTNREKPLPPGLILVTGAENVRVTDENDGSVMYDSKEAYPATSAISMIHHKLTEAGWRPLEKDVLNPSMPTSLSTGWGQFQDLPVDGRRVEKYQWLEQWESPNGTGTVAWYVLTYDAEVDSLGVVRAKGPLRVTATLLSKNAIKAMRDAAPPGQDQASGPAVSAKIADVDIRTVDSSLIVQYRTQTSIRDCKAQVVEMPAVWNQLVKAVLQDSKVQRVVLFPEDASRQSVSVTFTKNASGQWTAVAACSVTIPLR